MIRTRLRLLGIVLFLSAIALTARLGAAVTLQPDFEPGQHAFHSEGNSSRLVEQVREVTATFQRVRVSIGWSRTAFGVNLNLARYGEFCSFTLNPADDQEYSPKWLTDLAASYRVAGYRVAVGAQNLFDVFPDRNSTVNSFNGIQTFPSQSPFGMNGRTICGRIGRRF